MRPVTRRHFLELSAAGVAAATIKPPFAEASPPRAGGALAANDVGGGQHGAGSAIPAVRRAVGRRAVRGEAGPDEELHLEF